MTTRELLIAARDLIASPGAWTQGTYARNALGESTPLQGADAVCWCASGAVLKVLEDESWDDSSGSLWDIGLRLMQDVIETQSMMTVPTWNDEESRTHGEVLAMFDSAIEAAE